MNQQHEAVFWNDKRVFITGHTGFKGAWLSLWLTSLGAKVTGYSIDTPTNPSLHVSALNNKRLGEINGDVRDLDFLKSSLLKAQPDIVLHLAAQSLVRKSYHSPIDTFDVNVMGTIKVLEAIRSVQSVKAVVVVTSDKCYENREWFWGYRECEAMGGHDPYSASKGCAELVTESYIRSFFKSNDEGEREHTCAIATARAGNVIGGGDWAEDRLVPDILRDLSKDRPIEVRSPNSIRPWQHVLEPLSGYISLAQHLYEQGALFNGGWNFGPSDEGAKTVSWVADEMVSQWGSGSWFISGDQHPHEAKYLKLDSSKARAKLNWLPVWGPEKALEATIRWHKSWLNKQDMAAETLKDIELYSRDRAELLSEQ